MKVISTHDLTRRSTVYYYYLASTAKHFNSRPHEEVDSKWEREQFSESAFQLTTSRGGRQILNRYPKTIQIFQLTTSRGGRR